MDSTMALSLCLGKVLDDPIDEPKKIPKKKGVVANKRGETQEDIHGSGKEFRVEDKSIKLPEVKAYVLSIPFPQRLVLIKDF